jgi:hypothetical protein
MSGTVAGAGAGASTLVAVSGAGAGGGPGGPGATLVAVSGAGPGAGTGPGATLVAVSGAGAGAGAGAGGVGPAQDAISIYCIGLYKAKKALSKELFKIDRPSINFSGDEFKYYPNIIIEKVEKGEDNNVYINITSTALKTQNAAGAVGATTATAATAAAAATAAGTGAVGATTATAGVAGTGAAGAAVGGGVGSGGALLHYSGFKNLLNTSPKELIQNKTIPTTTLQGTTDEDIQDFVKQITDYSYVPFCMMMQFYMNPESILTKEYSPYQLSLMSGLTIEPKENQKGELMCNFDDTLSIGTEFLATPGTPEIPPSIKTFDDLKTTLLKKSAPIPPLKNGNYNINNSLITKKVISGGGLKGCRGTSCPSPNLPRIYRQVIKLQESFERRTDYYNYA